MAKILDKTTKTIMGASKGGAMSGLVAGLTQGIPAMVGLHPFLARIGGGLLGSALVKNPIDKRIILNESVKEGVYQLLAGE